MTKTHGKLNHDYITGSCTQWHDYFGVYRRKFSQSLGNIGSSRTHLITHPGVAKSINYFFLALLPSAIIKFFVNLKKMKKKLIK